MSSLTGHLSRLSSHYSNFFKNFASPSTVNGIHHYGKTARLHRTQESAALKKLVVDKKFPSGLLDGHLMPKRGHAYGGFAELRRNAFINRLYNFPSIYVGWIMERRTSK